MQLVMLFGGGGKITRIIDNSTAITLHLLDLEHAR